MLIARTQYGDCKILKDAKKKTIIEAYGMTSAVPMYQDTLKGESIKVGYVLMQRDSQQLWVSIYYAQPYNFNFKKVRP